MDLKMSMKFVLVTPTAAPPRLTHRLPGLHTADVSVKLEKGTVTCLLKRQGSVHGVHYKTQDGHPMTAYAPLTIVCDGSFSNLRRDLSNSKALQLSLVNFKSLTRFVNWRNCFDGNSCSKMSSCKCGLMNFLNFSNPLPTIEKREVVKETVNYKESSRFDADEDDDDKQERCDEDEVLDIMTLRRLVKMERKRTNDAYSELEKERTASTTATKEAMAMILRLQNQISVLELEYQQQRRLTHEKQLHDQEVIQSLRWIVMKHESERSILEDRLRLCKQRLMICMNDDGDDGCERVTRSLSCLDALDEGLVSSLDLGLSPW